VRTLLTSFVLTVVVAASCAKKDNSADTDHASQDLQKAQAAVSDKRREVAANEVEIEGKKRELIKGQQDLADKTQWLEDDRQQLGSARGTLVEARAAYGTAVTERLAKLDAALAGLATQTDATSKDALAGLRARRDLLAAKLATMPVTAEPGFTEFTRDVDTMFDAIENDLRAARS
jgi:predicted  nucleic acid-binding Zn-ribbon protein